MSVVEQKKESIRAALQELESPASTLSAHEAMKTLHQAVFHDFDDEDGSIGDFAGDDEFKVEIFSARVVQVVMDASPRDKEAFPFNFYHLACSVLFSLCNDNTELANAFVAHDGALFLLEYLEAFSSDQFLLLSCFMLYRAVIESLDDIDKLSFAGMTLGKIVEVFEVNYETSNEYLYEQYCVVVTFSFSPGCKVKNNLFQRIVSHVWHGVIKHKYDEDAQDTGRYLLRRLVGEETAKGMIGHAEMHHCEDEECAGCA
jgi:hypothetical protein